MTDFQLEDFALEAGIVGELDDGVGGHRGVDPAGTGVCPGVVDGAPGNLHSGEEVV